jgi:hypothetical protein
MSKKIFSEPLNFAVWVLLAPVAFICYVINKVLHWERKNIS